MGFTELSLAWAMPMEVSWPIVVASTVVQPGSSLHHGNWYGTVAKFCMRLQCLGSVSASPTLREGLCSLPARTVPAAAA